jgi:hypothetical protein
MTVFPQPKAPGIAVVPPCTHLWHKRKNFIFFQNNFLYSYGNNESKTRWPVNNGWLAASFSTTGRICRTGQICNIVCFVFSPSNSVSRTTSYSISRKTIQTKTIQSTNLEWIIALGCNICHGSFRFRMDHYSMFNHLIFWHNTEYITTGYMTTDLSIQNRHQMNDFQGNNLTRIRLSGVNSHGFLRSNAGTLIPRGM